VDSGGVSIVDNAFLSRADANVFGLELDLEISSDARTDDPILYQIRKVLSLEDHGILVASAGSKRLFRFDSSGRFDGSIGGPGEGPGEFRRVYGLFRCLGDTIVVNEGARLSFLKPDGGFLKTVRAAGSLFRASGAVQGLSSDCASVLVVDGSYRSPTPGSGVYQDSHSLFWADLQTAANDTILARFPGMDLYPWKLGDQWIGQRLPFGRTPEWATDGERTVYAPSGEPEILEFDREGNLKRIVRWNAPPIPVTGESLRRIQDQREEFIQLHSIDPREVPTIQHFPIPEQMPTLSRLILDDEGRIWVRKYQNEDLYETRPSGELWWIFSSHGEWLGTVVVEAGFEIMDIRGNRLFGIYRDNQDVEVVRVYRLISKELI
jgi:hypothetical protein